MNKSLVLMMIVFGFFGCGKSSYVHPNKTAGDFERDRSQCRKEFPIYASNMGFAPVVHVMTDGMEECLKARGWVEQSEQVHEEQVKPATKSRNQE